MLILKPTRQRQRQRRRWQLSQSSKKITLSLSFFALLLLIDPLLSFTTTTISRTTTTTTTTKSLATFSYIKQQHPSKTSRLLSIQRSDDNYDDNDFHKEQAEEVAVTDDYYNRNSKEEEEEEEEEEDAEKKSRRQQRGGQQQQQQNRSTRSENYYEEEEEQADDYYDNGDQEEYEDRQTRGGYYKVVFNEEVDSSETQIDWEVCYSDGGLKADALVLLPPASVERPTAIIHFVGGTFFGSNPKIWYRSLLESIVRSTSTAIIVTPIPVTLFKNPLQHIQLSQKIKRAFQNAWLTVLEDEYGEDVLRDIPLCGLGHSLGARLLTVLTTADQNQPKSPERVPIPPYKSLCLVSFTNYGAKVGIPDAKYGSTSSRYYDDEYDDEYNNDDVDEEWSELVEDLQETVTEQANRLRTAFTPKSKDLEFFPTPDQLWEAIKDDKRYKVNNTLIVQFDNDPIDQSSKLAQILHDTNSSDVKFARLRGTHLDPVSITTDSEGGDDNRNGQSQTTITSAGAVAVGLGSLIEKTIKGNNKNREHKIAMRDLRQSIISYITDVVTK
ncbi:hypothetical protein FRACYDRAFT_183125 [Fragilariopsis cylindrus CCMP1102]|uniref:DUF1350-domain-containing protein n=1 Tax=Fragilariopsis cylindrus CCMP1102 TaxID=635003 RepID=A0A1E7FJW3_9STRA|nr:hypothetical protein FRACYDRAFT_183125 [Fragilariopsis cylindrus CCMP1102]|eukprot:OEU18434.1 hypothetical protein FRACYDRAFT_183125 [Fragilariopsis cylindrus CCMP1102]